MKRWTLTIFTFFLSACASTATLERPTLPPQPDSEADSEAQNASADDTGRIVPEDQPPSLPNMGPAPELENEVWLNTDGPLRLADLRGKVVALDMWTFG